MSDSTKQIRLSLACNPCRKRKVRCDAQQPKCRNCSLRGDVCETNDLRKPGQGPGVRKRAKVGHHPRSSDRSPTATETTAQSISAASPSVDNPGSPEPEASRGSDNMSWISRAHAQTVAYPEQQQQQQMTTAAASTVSPDVLVHSDGTPDRFKFMGASSLQCLFHFVDLHLGQMGYAPMTPLFNRGMRHVVEVALPLWPPADLLQVAAPPTCAAAVEVYFSRAWPLFPVVERSAFVTDLSRFWEIQERGQGPHELTPTDMPALAIVYAVLAIGADEMAGMPTEAGTRYLHLAYGLLPQLFALPYLSSIQALFLLALALRGRTKDGQTFQLVAQAIRMAQSMGLHKEGEGPQTDLHRRVWWSCYSLEKLVQLESGRPSIVQGLETPALPGQDHFTAWVSLAHIMGDISERLYLHKFTSSREMLAETARLDQELLDWQRSLPPSLHASASVPVDMIDDDEAASKPAIPTLWLSQQFHQAQLALLRSCLMFPYPNFVAEIRKRKADLPPSHRLINGPVVCAAAARDIVTQQVQLADQGVRSAILGVTQVLQAAVALALSILRQPGKRQARTDAQLLSLAVECVEDHYTRWGQDAGYVSMLREWRENVVEVVQRRGRGSAGDTGRSSVDAAGSVGEVATYPAQPDESFYNPDETINLFGDLEFDEFWNMMESEFMVS